MVMDVISACSYQCAAKYNVAVSGSQLTATPTNANPSAGCTCYTLTATIGRDGVASGSVGGNTYLLTATSTGVRVDATVDGVTCTGSSSGNTASKTTTTSRDTSAATTTSALSAMVVAGTVLAATALTVTGFA